MSVSGVFAEIQRLGLLAWLHNLTAHIDDCGRGYEVKQEDPVAAAQHNACRVWVLRPDRGKCWLLEPQRQHAPWAMFARLGEAARACGQEIKDDMISQNARH